MYTLKSWSVISIIQFSPLSFRHSLHFYTFSHYFQPLLTITIFILLSTSDASLWITLFLPRSKSIVRLYVYGFFFHLLVLLMERLRRANKRVGSNTPFFTSYGRKPLFGRDSKPKPAAPPGCRKQSLSRPFSKLVCQLVSL